VCQQMFKVVCGAWTVCTIGGGVRTGARSGRAATDLPSLLPQNDQQGHPLGVERTWMPLRMDLHLPRASSACLAA
jgi:hypothetical protein